VLGQEDKQSYLPESCFPASNILLRSDGPSSKHVKLTNNWDHAVLTMLLHVRATWVTD